MTKVLKNMLSSFLPTSSAADLLKKSVISMIFFEICFFAPIIFRQGFFECDLYRN